MNDTVEIEQNKLHEAVNFVMNDKRGRHFMYILLNEYLDLWKFLPEKGAEDMAAANAIKNVAFHILSLINSVGVTNVNLMNMEADSFIQSMNKMRKA